MGDCLQLSAILTHRYATPVIRRYLNLKQFLMFYKNMTINSCLGLAICIYYLGLKSWLCTLQPRAAGVIEKTINNQIAK